MKENLEGQAAAGIDGSLGQTIEPIGAILGIEDFKPRVHRDRAGRTQWKLPGNTEEENLQIGIQNILGLFLEQFPDFEESFSKGEDGKIVEEKRVEAGRSILERVGSKDHFRQVFGESARLRRNTPYFAGSYRTALQLSFAPWGITFDFQTLEQQRAITCGEDDWVTIQGFATKHDLAHSTVKALLEDLQPISRIDQSGRQRAFYREEDLLSCCKYVLDLPKVDKNTGIYVDENNDEWAPANYFTRGYGLHDRLFAEAIEGLSHINGRGKSGQMAVLYRTAEVLAKFEDVFSARSLPQIDKEAGKYIDESGEEWVTAYDACLEMGIDKSTFLRYVDRIRSMAGRDKTGRTRTLYSVPDINQYIGAFLSLPVINEETGKYLDEVGREWADGTYFTKQGYGQGVISRLGRSTPSIDGRDRMGRKTKLYAVSELETVLVQFLSLPQVAQATGRYTDENGNSWMTASTLAKGLNLSGYVVRRYVEDAVSIRGRDTVGKEVTLYSETEAMESLKILLSLPIVDKQLGVYMDESRDAWVPLSYLEQKYGARGKSIQDALKGAPQMVGRDKLGRRTRLYSEIAAVAAFSCLLVNKPKTDRETEEYIDEYGNVWGTISHFSMQLGIDREALIRYLGGVDKIPGLASNGKRVLLYNRAQVLVTVNSLLELPQVDKEKGEFVDQEGEVWITLGTFCKGLSISQTGIQVYLSNCSVMQGRDRQGRSTTLYKREELFHALDTKLSIGKRSWATIPKVQRNKLIEEEIARFLEAGGALSQSGLSRGGKKWLIAAIYKYYPGGLTAIKEKFQSATNFLEEKPQVSPEEANRKLLRLLEGEDED